MQNKKKQVTDPPKSYPAKRTLFSGTKAKIKNNSKKTRRTNIVDKCKTKKTQYHDMEVARGCKLKPNLHHDTAYTTNTAYTAKS